MMQRSRAQRPPRAVPTPTEEVIHRAVAAHLARRALGDVVHWHVPNGELRRPGVAGKLRAMGTRAGMPDMMLLRQGQLYGLELKREGGRVSEAQRATLADLEASGATVAVAYGLDDALCRLKGWGLIR